MIHGDIESRGFPAQGIERGLIESQLEPRIAMVVFLGSHQVFPSPQAWTSPMTPT